jgi:hypothetical protein
MIQAKKIKYHFVHLRPMQLHSSHWQSTRWSRPNNWVKNIPFKFGICAIVKFGEFIGQTLAQILRPSSTLRWPAGNTSPVTLDEGKMATANKENKDAANSGAYSTVIRHWF